MSQLKGMNALVTGASRGIGKAIALELARRGAHVIVNFLNHEEKAQETLKEITAAGGTGQLCRFDVSNTEETQSAISTVLKALGTIHIVVNNSGITKDGLLMRYSTKDWDTVQDTNLRSAFVVSQAVLRPMIKTGGAIIHISSISGVQGNPGQAAYCAAKAGLIGLAKSMARELAGRNIRVNVVAPGYIQTDMTSSLTPEQKEGILSHIPLGREGTASEIAHAVGFLASPEASYITGQVLLVDGGMGI